MGPGGVERELVVRSVRLFAEQVMPRFRSSVGWPRRSTGGTMAIPAKRDLDVARKSIGDWLAGLGLHDGALTVGELVAPGGTGFSNETLLFDATWGSGAI